MAEQDFDAFVGAILKGMEKGLKVGQTLTFAWCDPHLRVLVEGAPCGDIASAELFSTLFKGFFGKEPSSPDMKEATGKGLPRLFKEA